MVNSARVIDFQPDEEQELVVETVREFAAQELRPRAREADEARKLPAELLERAHTLGLVANALPEAHGGGGARSALTGVLIAEQLAWGDLALALAILSPGLLALPLAEFGSAAQQAEWLPALRGSRVRAWRAGLGRAALRLRRVPARDARAAQRARTGGSTARSAWCPGSTGSQRVGVRRERWRVGAALRRAGRCAGSARHARDRTWGCARCRWSSCSSKACAFPRRARIAGGPAARGRARHASALAALAVGVARAAFELARDYAKQRETFGAPIATRQSIAFMLADMATEIDGAAPARLGGRLAARPRTRRHARGRARDLTRRGAWSMQCADGAVQIFGGHGYTREYLPELLLRNAAGFASFEALALV